MPNAVRYLAEEVLSQVEHFELLELRYFDVQLGEFVAAEVQDPKLAEQEKGLWKAGQLIAPKIQ